MGQWKPATTKKEYKVLWEEHHSIREVAEALRISSNKARFDLDRFGIKRIGQIAPAVSKDEYLTLWGRHGNVSKISKILKKSNTKVRNDLERLGIRKIGYRKAKPSSSQESVGIPQFASKGRDLAELIKILRKSRLNVPQIASELGLKPKDIPAVLQNAYDNGYYLRTEKIGDELFYYVPKTMVTKDRVIKDYFVDATILRFAVVSDTHLASKHDCLDELHSFYDICQEEGIKRIYHVGDIIEGRKVYRGQENEVRYWGLDDQVDYLVENYPQRDGIETWFISGGHDETVLKNESIDMGRRIVDRALAVGRKDLVYLGQSYATIEILPGIFLEMIHPGGGTAYAVSYNAQKYVESVRGGTKPNILLRGHGHKSMQMPRRGIQIFEAGCFQKQTPFMRGRGLIAEIGGWIIEIQAVAGSVRSIIGRWIPYY